MAEDTILYQDEQVTVTSKQAFLEGKTYPIGDILTVSVRRARHPSQFMGAALLGIGFTVWVLGLLFWYYSGSSLVQPFLLGLIFIGLGVWQRRETRGQTRFVLQIIDTRGKSLALSSAGRARLEAVEAALHQAMDRQNNLAE